VSRPVGIACARVLCLANSTKTALFVGLLPMERLMAKFEEELMAAAEACVRKLAVQARGEVERVLQAVE
jgi:hypothetical protein